MRYQLRTRARLWELLAIGLGLLVAGVSIVSVVVYFAIGYINVGLMVGQPELVLTLAHLAAAAMVLVFGIAFVMGSMYFSDDAAMLLSWPLRPRQIVSAKVATVLVNEYITMGVILIPVYVVYALNVPVSPWYIPAAILTFLFTPMIPLMLATLLTMLLMRVTGGRKRRDLFTIVGGILGIAVALGVQYFLQAQFPEGAGEMELAQMLFEQVHGLSQVVAAGYPPSLWGMESLAAAGTAAGWLALLKLIGAGVVLFSVMLVVGERVFTRSLQEGREGRRQRAAASEAQWKDGNAVDAVARAERKLFMRTPIYVLNGFAGLLLIPFLLVLPMSGDGESLRVVLQELTPVPAVGALILAAWFAGATAISSMAPTAFSREGYRLWILKSLPISGREFFLGKLKGDLTMILLGSIPGAVVLIYLLKLPVVAIATGLVLGSVIATLIAMLSLAVDMVRPMLGWTDPTRAMKSNLNVLIAMLLTVVIGVVAFVTGRLLLMWGADYTVLLGIALVVALAVTAGVWKLISPRLDQWLWRMGD